MTPLTMLAVFAVLLVLELAAFRYVVTRQDKSPAATGLGTEEK